MMRDNLFEVVTQSRTFYVQVNVLQSKQIIIHRCANFVAPHLFPANSASCQFILSHGRDNHHVFTCGGRLRDVGMPVVYGFSHKRQQSLSPPCCGSLRSAGNGWPGRLNTDWLLRYVTQGVNCQLAVITQMSRQSSNISTREKGWRCISL